MPNNLTWEDRYITVDLADPDAFEAFFQEAIDRAEELEEDDIAEELEEQNKELQRAIDEAHDTLYRLDQVEKYVAAHPNWRDE